ncbi:MAG: Ornithine cyclodeaminase [Polaromonas sp.]|nr:Ornithine cyclodeaminase [Polaromonas sp.]
MALYLGQSDLDTLFAEGLVTPADCVEAVAGSFHEQGLRQVGVMPRQIVWADAAQTAPRSPALKMSAAYMRGSRIMGASIYAVQFTPGSVDMWLTVFSGVTGQMIGVLNSKSLSIWKTAATAAVAARCLARSDAHRVALIGTGSYAMAQIEFLAAVMEVEKIFCFSRNADTLRQFCIRASEKLGLPVSPAASAQAAVEDADMITTITISPTPVVLGEWLPAGVHCNVMGQHAPGAREIDTRGVLESHVIVDATEQAFNEKGELLIPISEGAMTSNHVAGELGSVLTGNCAGRTSHSQKTMFCSGGTAFEYMGLCSMLLERAAAAGLGQQLKP